MVDMLKDTKSLGTANKIVSNKMVTQTDYVRVIGYSTRKWFVSAIMGKLWWNR